MPSAVALVANGPPHMSASIAATASASRPTHGANEPLYSTPSGRAPTATTTSPHTAGGGPAVNGKSVFESAGCSGCHTLKDAGATGTVGPDLDQLKPSKALVVHQVETGGGAMPSFKGRLTQAQINAVAGYVSSVAGK